MWSCSESQPQPPVAARPKGRLYDSIASPTAHRAPRSATAANIRELSNNVATTGSWGITTALAFGLAITGGLCRGHRLPCMRAPDLPAHLALGMLGLAQGARTRAKPLPCPCSAGVCNGAPVGRAGERQAAADDAHEPGACPAAWQVGCLGRFCPPCSAAWESLLLELGPTPASLLRFPLPTDQPSGHAVPAALQQPQPAASSGQHGRADCGRHPGSRWAAQS